MARYNPENKPYSRVFCNLGDYSTMFLKHSPEIGDAGFFKLTLGSDYFVGIDLTVKLEELPKMIKRLTEFKEQLEKQGVKFDVES